VLTVKATKFPAPTLLYTLHEINQAHHLASRIPTSFEKQTPLRMHAQDTSIETQNEK